MLQPGFVFTATVSLQPFTNFPVAVSGKCSGGCRTGLKNPINAIVKKSNSVNIMKTAISNSLKVLLGAMLLAGAIVTPVSAEPKGVVHSINGSGLIVVKEDFFWPGSPAFSFRQEISAWQRSDGTVGGTFVVQIWGLTPGNAPVVLLQEVTCLTVDGNTAYTTSVIRWSSNPNLAKPGDEVAFFVTDSDGNGPDISWSGPAQFFLAPGQDCTSHPFMPQVPIASGNFIVR